MSRKSVLIMAGILTPLIGTIIAYQVLNSPSRVLRFALNLERLPPSIRDLRMGEDIWTDVVYGFYFEIAPSEFPDLLMGHQFSLMDNGRTFDVHAIHVDPGVGFAARWQYRWEKEGTYCQVSANEEKSRVIIVYATD